MRNSVKYFQVGTYLVVIFEIFSSNAFEFLFSNVMKSNSSTYVIRIQLTID